ALTRDHHGDLFLSTILEGPSKWTVRPVAEVFYEEEFGKERTLSGLIGLIYQVRDNLSFDVGIRHALTNGRPVDEIRAGLTFGFPLSFFEGQAAQRGGSAIRPRWPGLVFLALCMRAPVAAHALMFLVRCRARGATALACYAHDYPHAARSASSRRGHAARHARQ